MMGLVLCVLPGGKAKLGGLDAPEFTNFQWGSMIMCTLLAGGGVFWAAGEPMAHFISSPPLFGAEGKSAAAAAPALAQSFLHWGFLAWAILGALTTVMLMHYHYEKGLPLSPRTLLYPVFGDKAINGPIGLIADASCINASRRFLAAIAEKTIAAIITKTTKTTINGIVSPSIIKSYLIIKS